MVRTGASEEFWCRTSDEVWLHGRLSTPGPDAPIVLLCHGFTGGKSNDAMELLHAEIGDDVGVAAFDFRGHGHSSGHSTLGDREALDVDAVALMLRERYPAAPLVGVGFSMGGAAVVRAAALHGSLDAVVAFSAPPAWRMPRKPAVMLAALLTRTRAGRHLLRRIGVRVHRHWSSPEAPVDIAADISPVPIALVYGTDDNYFTVADGMELYEALAAPKSFLTIEGGGHGEKLSTIATARLLRRLVHDLLERGIARECEHLMLSEAAV